MARTDVPEDGGFSLGYRPQLDGIRAVAVVAVMLFHASIGFNERGELLPGGYLGVDVFFALSGFLITTILAQEWLRRSRIDLRAFYARRALRLLPAIALVLVAVLVLAQVVLTPGAAHFARRQSLWTALYGQNWHAVVSPARFPGGAGKSSICRTLAAPWRWAVPTQSEPVSPPPRTITCLPRASTGSATSSPATRRFACSR